MSVDFKAIVRWRLDEFLLSKGFRIDQLIDADTSGWFVVLYKSRTHQIELYRSQRDGEVNCLIGDANADPRELNSGKGWTFLSSLLQRDRELSIEELLARVPSAPKGATEQLEEVATTLEQHFDELVSKKTISRQSQGYS